MPIYVSASTRHEELRKEQARRKEEVQQPAEANLTLLREDTWAYGRGSAGGEWRDGKERARERGEGRQQLGKQGGCLGKLNQQNRTSKVFSSLPSLSSPELVSGHSGSIALNIRRAC